MDCVVVTSLLGMVEQLQQLLLQKWKSPHNNNNNNNPYCFILSDDSQIILSSLKEKLHFLQAYLDQPKPILITSDPDGEAVKRLDEEIRDVAIKAEDEMESKLGELYLAENQGECTVAVKAAFEDLHWSLQKAVKDIECVEVRIRDLHLQEQKTHLDSDVASSSTPPCLQLEENVSSSKYDLENTMIGVEGDVEEIKDMLLIQSSSSSSSSTQLLQVVSIVGVAGTGRTCLAKKVYEDPSIVSHFDIQAWTVATHLYSMRKVVIGILGCIVSLTNERISKQDDEHLAKQLRKVLMGQRYLIVIDDLWSTEAWDELTTYFPDNRNGSRVLITTRMMHIADYTGSGMYIYRTRFLNTEESWNLLSKTATSNGKCSLPPEFELIGKCIAKKCEGMPLLITLIGGILATLNNSPKQWQDIDTELNSSSLKGVIELLHYSIHASYNYLPTHLKACFLYLGTFPYNTEIHVKKLIKLWIAEGFVKLEMNKSFEEIAEDYLGDLINRRLVQVHKRSLNGKIKSCMLHDLLYEFCFLKARGDNIVMVTDDYHNTLEPHRWVSHQSTRSLITPSYLTNSSLKTRSFFYFDENLYLAKHWLILSSFKLLRVLDLSFIKYWHGIPSEIVDLVHLRYLALTTIGSIWNSQLFKLQSLQTLILSSWTKECQLQLPCDVLDLPWLRHVRFDKGSSSYLPNLVQENLQTLSWFKVTGRDSRTTNFTKVPNLKELGMYIEGEVLHNALDSLAHLHQLEKLKVKMGRVERFNLPNSFPPNLKQLTLSNTYLSWDDMDIIGKLPNLDLLKLKDFAFCGPEWTPKDGEFMQLRFFLIERSDLEHWNANANHFPALKRLILRYCWDLEKLPNDFKELYTLRLIELDNCCSSLLASAREIEQEQRYGGLVVCDVTKAELPTDECSEKRSDSAI